MDAWMDRWIEKLKEGQIYTHKDGQKDRRMDGWMDGQADS
jgi:hypothetical protein